MVQNSDNPIDIQDVEPSFSLNGFLLVMLASLAGAVVAVSVLPNWIPGLSQSISGPDPTAFWYLSRGSAFTAYFILWFSMVFGVGVTNKLAVIWPGLPPAIELHQYTSILGLAFGIFHGLILLGDHFINFKLAQVLVPFSTLGFKPISVGIGQIAFYLWLIIVVSFYVRKKVGSKVWRGLHFLSFLSYAFALLHGISSGTDASSLWAQIIYWTTGIILLYLIIYRILYARSKAMEKRMKTLNRESQPKFSG